MPNITRGPLQLHQEIAELRAKNRELTQKLESKTHAQVRRKNEILKWEKMIGQAKELTTHYEGMCMKLDRLVDLLKEKIRRREEMIIDE